MKLSDKTCKSAQPSGTKAPKKLSDGGGLQLWTMPNGSKYWRYKYRIGLKEKNYAIGTYPEISLSEARDRHRKARKLVEQGIDPSVLKQEKKLKENLSNDNTFKSIALDWLEKKKHEVKPSTASNIQRRLEIDVFPLIGNLPIRSVSPQTILAMIKKIERRGAYELAVKARQHCSQIFRYAVALGEAERDVTIDISAALTSRSTKHLPALEPDKLPVFLNALDKNDARLFIQTRLALELLLLTFVRPNELAGAELAEINFNDQRWIIPARRMKMNKDHIVPLSRQAINIIQRLIDMNGENRYLFINQFNPNKHMPRDTLSKAIRNMGFQGQHTPHGFRALAMTALQEKLNYPFHVIDSQLAHTKKNSLGAAYDRAQFLEQRIIMMQDWADYIDSIRLK